MHSFVQLSFFAVEDIDAVALRVLLSYPLPHVVYGVYAIIIQISVGSRIKRIGFYIYPLYQGVFLCKITAAGNLKLSILRVPCESIYVVKICNPCVISCLCAAHVVAALTVRSRLPFTCVGISGAHKLIVYKGVYYLILPSASRGSPTEIYI